MSLHDDLHSVVVERIPVDGMSRLFQETSPPVVISKALTLLRAIPPETYDPIDLYVALYAASDEDDLATRRALTILRRVRGRDEPPRVTHRTYAECLVFLEKARDFSLLLAAGVILSE